MTLIDLDSAEEIVGPYLPEFAGIMKQSWQDYQNLPAELRRTFDTTTRANIVNNLAGSRAAEVFADRAPAVVVHDTRSTKGYRLLCVQNTLMIKINKRRGGELKCGGIPTQARMDFLDQRQPALAGFPQMTNAYLLYGVDQTGSAIATLDLVCRTDKHVHWRIPVALDAQATVLQYPAASANSTGPVEALGPILRSTAAGSSRNDTKKTAEENE